MRSLLLLGIVLAGCSVDADDAPPDLRRELVIDEVGASGDPDWFVVVNATDAPLHLADYLYVDTEGDLERAARFPAVTLAPGARHVETVLEQRGGFKLGSDEELWIYRDRDGEPSDAVDWADGASPAGGSYRRRPSVTGDFLTVIGG
jgi:hypothetical protein